MPSVLPRSPSSISYHALGNVTSDAVSDPPNTHTYTYDAENRVIVVDSGTSTEWDYKYDALGRRIQKTDHSGNHYDEYYDLNGRLATEYYNGGWRRSEIYAGGMHLGNYWGGQTNFMFADWLGNLRMLRDQNGDGVEACIALPFGDGTSCTGTHYANQLFTGDELDSESNTEHTLFRQLSGTQGRWLSPDPYFGSIDITNPQSMNRYAYVGNNPVNNVDPIGLFFCSAEFSFQECGGWSAMYHGTYGDTLASYNREFRNFPISYEALNGIAQIDNQADAAWSQMGVKGTPSAVPSDTVINVNCNELDGTAQDWRCAIAAGSAWGLIANPLQTIYAGKSYWRSGSPQFNFATAATWSKATNTVNDLGGVYISAYAYAISFGAEAVAEIGEGEALFGAWPRGYWNGGARWGNLFRVGWGGVAPNVLDGMPAGGEIFRIVVGGPKTAPFWFHIP